MSILSIERDCLAFERTVQETLRLYPMRVVPVGARELTQTGDGKRCHFARGFLGWNEARPLASHATDQRAAWLFKLNALETVARLVACVVRSSHFDFPRASLWNKPLTMPFLRPRSSAEIRARHPGLCKKWLVGTKDKSGRILTLLSSLEDVLSEVTLIREIETSGKHLMIVGECEFSREHLPRFLDEAGRILESLGEGDLFVGMDWTES